MTATSSLFRGGFRWFFVGRAIDLGGASMTPVVITLAVLAESGSPTDLGIVLASTMIPTLAFLLLGGVLGDRFSRRNLLVGANLVEAAVLGLMALTLLTNRYSLVTFALLGAASGIAGAISGPALRGIVPQLVAAERMQQANASLATARNVARIGGPALAGLLATTVGGGWALAVNAVTACLAGLCYLPIPTLGAVPRSESILRDLAAGWRAFISLRWVVVMSLSFALINAIYVGPWQVLGPSIIVAEDGAMGWSVIISVRAVGLLLASMLFIRLTFKHPLRAGRFIGVLGSLPLLALGLSDSTLVVAVAVAAAIGGVGLTAINITYDSTLQTRVPNEVLSRVASFDDLIAYLAIPASQLLVGPAIAALGVRSVAIWCGALFAVVAVLPLAAPSVRRVDEGE